MNEETKRKILIVDDDGAIRELYKSIVGVYFDPGSISIVMGVDGEDGWREFQESQPDLVITDLEMETSDAGFKLAEKIKNESPKTPVIMITGALVEARNNNVVDCLMSKPVPTKVLADKIEELLSIRKEA